MIDDAARLDLQQAVERARELRRSELRPPVTENERLCSTCSLAPVCLPEEERGKSEQRRYLMRASRGNADRREVVASSLDRIRETLARLPKAASLDTIRGLEGMAAKSYFAALPSLISEQATTEMIPRGRTKHPPKDRFNCLLSYGYAMLFGLVHRSLIAVGLEPAFGYFHQPRSAAPPLVLDVMELFRTAVWDMPLIGSVNRAMWNDSSLFCISPGQVWLSDSGKKQAIQLPTTFEIPNAFARWQRF